MLESGDFGAYNCGPHRFVAVQHPTQVEFRREITADTRASCSGGIANIQRRLLPPKRLCVQPIYLDVVAQVILFLPSKSPRLNRLQSHYHGY